MNHTQRIAFLVPNLNAGGLVRVAIQLLNGFLEEGFSLDLVLASATGELLNDIPSSIRIIDLKIPIEHRFSSASKLIFPLIRYLRTEKPDALFTHLWLFNVVTAIARTLALSPTKLIFVEHGSFKLAYGRKGKADRLPEQVLPMVRRWFYPHTDAVIAVSRGLAQELEADLKMKPGSIQTIYNPVIDQHLLSQGKANVEHPWFQLGEPPVILGVGRLTQEKDFPTLIRAFAQVRQVKPARLMILGEGNERQRLWRLVCDLSLEQDVALLGFVPNPQSYMAKATVFVLSSYREGFGNVLVEAMATGTPVVSTNCPNGPAEILDNGKYGELVPVEDAQAMAQAILQVLSGNFKSVDLDWLNQFTFARATQQYLKILGM